MNRQLGLVNVIAVLIGIAYGMHGPLLPIFATSAIGASYVDLGLIGLANFIPYMFIPFLVGLLLDRFNHGKLISMGIIINSASLYLLSIAQSVPEIMAYRAMTGVAHAFFWPPCQAIISEYSKGSERVKNIAKFTGFFVGGFTIGPLVASLMIAYGDEGTQIYRTIFSFSAYVLAAAIVSSVYISKTKTKERIKCWSLAALGNIFRFPEVIIMLLYCTSAFGMILTIYPAFLHERGITDIEIGILYFAFGVSRIISLFVVDFFIRRTALTLSVVTATIALSFVISFYAEGMIPFIIAMLLMGFGFSVFFPLTLDIVMGKKRKDTDGSMIGAYEAIFGIGWASGPLIAGFISDFHGGAAPYLAFCIAGIAITIMSLVRRNKLERASQDTAQ